MNSIVERLRIPGDEVFSTRKKWQLADLIEQQAERIKELEAAMPLYDELLIRCAIAEKELATLRQRIDDAPVVAEVEKERGLTYGNRGAAAVGTKLISKEDLK